MENARSTFQPDSFIKITLDLLLISLVMNMNASTVFKWMYFMRLWRDASSLFPSNLLNPETIKWCYKSLQDIIDTCSNTLGLIGFFFDK